MEFAIALRWENPECTAALMRQILRAQLAKNTPSTNTCSLSTPPHYPNMLTLNAAQHALTLAGLIGQAVPAIAICLNILDKSDIQSLLRFLKWFTTRMTLIASREPRKIVATNAARQAST